MRLTHLPTYIKLDKFLGSGTMRSPRMNCCLNLIVTKGFDYLTLLGILLSVCLSVVLSTYLLFHCTNHTIILFLGKMGKLLVELGKGQTMYVPFDSRSD